MSTELETLFTKVRATLEVAQTDRQLINVIRDHFFPPLSTGLPRPQKRSFCAARMAPCNVSWLKGNPTYHEYYVALAVAVNPELDYRYISLTYRGTDQLDTEVLLVTPKGLDTLQLKTDLFFYGWDSFLGQNPDFKVVRKEDLKLTRINHQYRPLEPKLVIERRCSNSTLRKTAILQPYVTPRR